MKAQDIPTNAINHLAPSVHVDISNDAIANAPNRYTVKKPSINAIVDITIFMFIMLRVKGLITWY